MGEEFGFSIHGMAYGMLLVGLAVVPILAALSLLCLRRKSKHAVPTPTLLMLILVALLGCVLAEAQILADEVYFARQAAGGEAAHFSRPRQWPHGVASLVYSADRGFWATD